MIKGQKLNSSGDRGQRWSTTRLHWARRRVDPILETEIEPPKNSSDILSNEFASIQWETATFYTYDAEVDGKPVPSGEPLPAVSYASRRSAISMQLLVNFCYA